MERYLTEYLNTIPNPDSPWAEIQDSEANIIQHLRQYTLDPVFEYYGNFINPHPQWIRPEDTEKYAGCTMFFGNFLTFSHAFRLITNDPGLIERLADAINRNKATPEYQTARDQMIERRKQRMERRKELIVQYGNYLGHEGPY